MRSSATLRAVPCHACRSQEVGKPQAGATQCSWSSDPSLGGSHLTGSLDPNCPEHLGGWGEGTLPARIQALAQSSWGDDQGEGAS